jgi:hypothetical protein
MSNEPEGRKDASNDNAGRPGGDDSDVRSEFDRDRESDLGAQAGQQGTAPGLGALRQGPLGLADMATVQTGDPYLDRMARAVAIDFLRSDA